MLGSLSLIVLMVSWGRKATEGGEKNRRKKEEEAATAEDEDKFTVMIMDTVDTVSPTNIIHWFPSFEACLNSMGQKQGNLHQSRVTSKVSDFLPLLLLSFSLALT